MQIIIPIIIVGVIGLVFGCLLSFASVVFSVGKDDRIESIEKVLPGANCGACGYVGCASYAEAIVNEDAPINCCTVGKDGVAQKIADIMGKKAQKTTAMVARVMCMGVKDVSKEKYEYYGMNDCAAQIKLSGGAKACPNGCLGLGNCVRVCKFDAICVIDGVAKTDEEKCTGCGMCVKECPKGVIALVPKKAGVWVACINAEKGNEVNAYCKAGCLGCKICEKICPEDAIKVEGNHAKIDYDKCINCGACAEKCPKKIIKIRF